MEFTCCVPAAPQIGYYNLQRQPGWKFFYHCSQQSQKNVKDNIATLAPLTHQKRITAPRDMRRVYSSRSMSCYTGS